MQHLRSRRLADYPGPVVMATIAAGCRHRPDQVMGGDAFRIVSDQGKPLFQEDFDEELANDNYNYPLTTIRNAH